VTERTLSLIQPRISLERNRLIDKKTIDLLKLRAFLLKKARSWLDNNGYLEVILWFKKDNSHSGKCLYSLTEKGMRTLDIYNVPSGKCLNATAESKG